MQRFFLPSALLLLALMLAPTAALAQQWTLVWSDEFDVDGLPDPNKWGYDVGASGWGNQELQYYTEARPENARVEQGVLVIEALRENFSGSAYTSARLVTRGKGDWTYARVEVSARLPAGRGTWPAIWMLPTDRPYGNGIWPDNGEIDIMEHVGFDPERVHGTVHMNRYNGIIGNQRGASKPVSGALDEFHLYAIEWTPKQIEFSIDGIVYFRYFNDGKGWITWPFDQSFHLLLNIAIGGTWGGQQGVDNSIFPARMEVDYVRVYENAALPLVTFVGPTSAQPSQALILDADVSINDGTITGVEFLQGDGVLGVDTEAPYQWVVEGSRAGCYQLRARATESFGWQTTTEPLRLTIGQDCPQAPYLIVPAPIPGPIEAEYFDLGGPNVGYRDLDTQNQGSGIRRDEGVDIETTADTGGGYHVGWIANREWLQYTVDVKTAGRYRVDARVASAATGGTFSLAFDGIDKSGDITFGATGDGQTFATATADGLELEAGVQVMRLRFRSGAYNINRLTFTLQSATANEADEVPRQVDLAQNYPNPFNPTTRIAFTLPQAGPVTLKVYDVYGRLVATLVDGPHSVGTHHVGFDAGTLPSGVYVYRLTTPTNQATRTMTLLR